MALRSLFMAHQIGYSLPKVLNYTKFKRYFKNISYFKKKTLTTIANGVQGLF
jgi:predicted patatin/cPLA2 family phospholipase